MADALAQQQATSEILALMAVSPAGVQAVLDAIARHAALLCGAPFARVLIVDGEQLRPQATYRSKGERVPALANPVPLQRTSISGRAVLERRTIHHADVFPLLDTEYPDARDNARRIGFHAVLMVPLLRERDAHGAIFLWRRAAQAFTPDQIAIVETFARQAAIAIENVRLFRATKEALEQQTATAEILRVISSSPNDVQPVFDTIAASALALCDGVYSALYRFDGELIHVAALHKLNPKASAAFHAVYPSPPSRRGVTHRAVLTGEIVHVPDVLADPEYGYQDAAKAAEFRSALSVPMLHDGKPIGTITVYRDEPKPFPDSQIALLKTFADQAVIAIENVRLFTELETRNRDLTVALEQQTATSEILRVISRSPTDAQPVFETIAANALRLCEGAFCRVYRYDGELIDIAASANLDDAASAAFASGYPTRPHRGGATHRAILTGEVVHIPDVLADAEYRMQHTASAAGFRSALSVPMLRDGRPIGTITVYRAEPKAFPDSQIALLRTFADQAIIAIENVRLFTELETRNRELTVALDQQTSTSEILRVISGAQTDLAPVFEAIVRAAVRLSDADYSVAARFDGAMLHPLAFHGFNAEGLEAAHRMFPMPPSRINMLGRAALSRSVIRVPDMLADPDYSREYALAGGWRSGIAVPMLRDGNLIGVIGISRSETGAFPDAIVSMLQTFADQAVIAIENVRLFTELQARNQDLTVALDQQTATSEILRAISSAQTDVRPVFEAMVRNAVRLCGGENSIAARFDGEMLQPLASHGFSTEALEHVARMFPIRPDRSNLLGRAALTRSVANIPDVLADTDYSQAYALAGGWRSGIGVPMLRDGELIGAIAVARRDVGAFPQRLVELLQTFADQAVIAIENVRLFTELQTQNTALTEALEQQTATAEILRVISRSPTDVQPVFDTIAANALRLCDGNYSALYRFDGELIHVAALHRLNPEGTAVLRSIFPSPPSRNSATHRAILTGEAHYMADVLADPEYPYRDLAIAAGYRSTLSVPMLHDGRPIGAIAVFRAEPNAFPDSQIALLKTFADQAVIAIENVRLFKELETRTEQLTRSVGELRALGEVGQAVSSTLDLPTVLATIVSRATALTGMNGGSIWEYDEATEMFHVHATDNLPEELIEALRSSPIRKGEGALGQVALTGEPVQIRDIAKERSYRAKVRELLIRCGYRSVLAVPLVREGHLLGGLIVNRNAPGDFAQPVIDLLKTFAAQSALAIQNARLFREIEVKGRQLEIASQHKSEFLANMSHELRTPLNAIIGFSEVLAEQMFGEVNAKQQEYLADILESGRHLLSLINDILDLSKIEAGRMELEPADFDLPGAIENAMILVRERASRHGITLGCTVDGRLGTIHADERKVKQVLLNLLSNALKFTPEGGAVTVRAARHDSTAEISVTDTGVGIASEDQAAVFEEFRQVGTASKKVEGTGLGLAISRKFVELHGGTIRLASEPGKGSTFTFTLPLR